jgi:hypothetical protein
MIGLTYPVLAPADSDWNLRRSLSALVPAVLKSPSIAPRRRRFPLWKPVAHLPSHHFTCPIPRDPRQKTIQYPAIRSGSVQ